MSKCKFLVHPVQILAEAKSDFKMNKQIYIINQNDEWVMETGNTKEDLTWLIK